MPGSGGCHGTGGHTGRPFRNNAWIRMLDAPEFANGNPFKRLGDGLFPRPGAEGVDHAAARRSPDIFEA